MNVAPYDPNNIFARILRGELPCIKVYEDEAAIAFMDIMPQSDGHTLVVPKEAAVTLEQLSPQAAAACIRVVQRVLAAVTQALEAPGAMIAQLNAPAGGQTVPHVHFHVIPRWEAVGMRIHAAEKADPAKLEAFAERIRAALAAQ